MTIAFEEKHYKSEDGLSLYFRDYQPAAPGTPIICLAGLTRNSKDFEDLAPRLAALNRRVLIPDLRGRGQSQYDPEPTNYQPAIYMGDVLKLMTELDIASAVFVGTSLGGIISMTIATAKPDAVRAVILNDVGPEIEPAGLARIRTYVGKGKVLPSWDQAAQAFRELNGQFYPDFSTEDWLMMARRTYKQADDGTIVPDYDPGIALPFAENDDGAPAADMWPLFAALASKPALVVRGALSDILSAATLDKMIETKPDLQAITVPNRGHVPLLNEADCDSAVREFINANA